MNTMIRSKWIAPLIAMTVSMIISMSSCISDDFSTSPNDLLTFSRDTVSFDTVFTDVGTPTARLLVFNRGKKGLNISRIGFRNPDTRFRINVDGMSGKEFHDVEVRGNDSIFVFIECTIPATEGNIPFLTEDKLEFVTNGVTQEVTVEAYGQNVTRLKGVSISGEMTLTDERPIVVFDSLVVAKDGVLKIGPGVKMLFHDKARLVVNGRLEAVGAQGRMIQMRSDRLDNVLPDVAYDILAGQWDGVRIGADSYDNRMEFVDMRSTVSGLVIDSCQYSPDKRKLLIVNSWLHNSQGSVLTSKYGNVDAYGVCFSESADAVVALHGGNHRFSQCTIANYYLFSAIYNPLLSLYNLFSDKTVDGQPMMNATFDNCIIYGLSTDINEGNLDGTNVYLRNVLLKSEGTDDEHFISCVWGADPLFYTVREDYYFNYRLKPESPAIGAGNAAYVNELCLYDMDGLNRLAYGSPDLGAYVFVAPPEEYAQAKRRR